MSNAATKFYLATNANRQIAGVRFESVDVFAGTLIGVFATDNLQLQEALAKEASTGVEEITAEEYEQRLKKKPTTLGELNHSNPNTPQQTPQAAIKGDGKAAVVDGKELEASKPEPAIATMEDVLKLAGAPTDAPPEPQPAKVESQPEPQVEAPKIKKTK